MSHIADGTLELFSSASSLIGTGIGVLATVADWLLIDRRHLHRPPIAVGLTAMQQPHGSSSSQRPPTVVLVVVVATVALGGLGYIDRSVTHRALIATGAAVVTAL